MLPELFRVGPFAVRSYGLMLALGFALGIVVLVRRGRARGLEAGRLVDLCLVMVVVGMLGGRLMYALTHWGEFAAQPWRVLWPIQPDGTVGLQGFVYYGGIVLALPVAVLLVRRWRLDPWKVLDAGAPGLALGTAVGRIGCFLNGCCFGRPTDGPFGVVFPPGCLAGEAFPGTPVHPTQLYMSLDSLLIAALLIVLDRRWGRFDGVIIGAYLILTGLTRGCEDLFRYYEPSMVIVRMGGFDLTVNHLVGVVLVVIGLGLVARARRRAPGEDTQDGGDGWSPA